MDKLKDITVRQGSLLQDVSLTFKRRGWLGRERRTVLMLLTRHLMSAKIRLCFLLRRGQKCTNLAQDPLLPRQKRISLRFQKETARPVETL
jgi:hypothetical protein